MKIDEAIRVSYSRQREQAIKLKRQVDKEIGSRKEGSWHYESRVKEEESFALKIECGRSGDPDAIEDIFACVVVVPNFSDVESAKDLVVSLYGDPIDRRPKSFEVTTKETSDFRFDDLRLYVRYRDQGYGPPSGLASVVFEVQVRTFLQHAWTIATHDIIYKSDNVNWRRERVAYHAKAALEQAEVTIESISALELSAALPETSKPFQQMNDMIEILKSNWEREQLPADIRRLAQGVQDLLRALSVNADQLQMILDIGRARYGGDHNLDWSPYRAVMQYLAEQHPAPFKRALQKVGRDPIFVYAGVLAELGLSPEHAPRATRLSVN